MVTFPIILACLIITRIIIAYKKLDRVETIKENKSTRRRQIKEVQPGEWIIIEWWMMKAGIGKVLCINNDPKEKKILIQIQWGNVPESEKFQQKIFNYSDTELKNFHLLNTGMPIKREQKQESEKSLKDLLINMNEALEKEEYEEAKKLQEKINNIIKK